MSDNYANDTKRTDLSDYSAMIERLSSDDMGKLIHYSLGMVTESAEFADQLKKHLAYGKPLDIVNLKEEIGDMLYYIARACDTLGTTIDEEKIRNINKLKVRFPEKFTEENARQRDLDAERRVLES